MRRPLASCVPCSLSKLWAHPAWAGPVKSSLGSQALPSHMLSQPTLCGGGWDPCRPGQGPQSWLLGPAGLQTGPYV